MHRAEWPRADDVRAGRSDPLVYEVASAVIGAVRKAKSEEQRSLAWPVARVVVRDTAARIAALEAARWDVCEAGKIASLTTEVADQFAVDVELAPPDPER